MPSNDEKSVNSPQEVREIIVEVPSPLPKRLAGYALLITCGIGVGALATGEIALAVAAFSMVSGIFIALVLNYTIIAPRAGEIAKQRVIDMFTSDNLQDQKLLQLASVNIIGNISGLSQHEEGKKLIKPIFYTAIEAFNESFDMRMKNLKSQVVKGAGEFAVPAEELTFDQIFAEGGHKFIMDTGQDMGLSEGLSNMLSQKLYLSLKGAWGGNSGSSPDKSGYTPLGGK